MGFGLASHHPEAGRGCGSMVTRCPVLSDRSPWPLVRVRVRFRVRVIFRVRVRVRIRVRVRVRVTLTPNPHLGVVLAKGHRLKAAALVVKSWRR